MNATLGRRGAHPVHFNEPNPFVLSNVMARTGPPYPNTVTGATGVREGVEMRGDGSPPLSSSL